MTVLHVVALPIPIDPDVAIDPRPFQRAGEKILQKASELTEQNGCKVETAMKVYYGNAGYEIDRIAQEGGFTLIVIHARGHSNLEKVLLGSVCHVVAHRTPCPVLIIRP